MEISRSEKSAYRFLTPVTTLVNVLVIVFAIAITVLNMPIAHKEIYAFVLVPLAILGIIYNLVLVKRLERRWPFIARYIQALFNITELLVILLLTGGTESPWYFILLLGIVACAVLGMPAAIINAIVLAIFYALDIIFHLIANSSSPFNFKPFPYALVAVFFSFLIAYTVDRYRKTNELANKITHQLDSTQFSEKLMLASIADPVLGVDKSRKIILMNTAAEELTNWETKDALGVLYTHVFKLKDGNDNDVNNNTDPFLKVFEQRDTVTNDQFYVLGKNGQKISLSISIAPTIDMDNNVSGAIAIFHDISEQKALQRERNEFVSTASHEMRTPVAAIEGYLAMATNPNLATVDERAKGFLEKAHDSALHLGKLFQDLLSVTKIEDKRLQESRSVFNLSDLVLQIASEMEVVAKKKGLKLFTHIGGAGMSGEMVVAPTYPVKADSERLREVITNLVDNAIKYTSQGSVDISLEGNKTTVTVKIHDTGVGISAEEQKHLFEKFYRVNNSFTREQTGTGLGLYIARSLIEMYGGKIWVESEEGKGSTFAFSLPLAKQ